MLGEVGALLASRASFGPQVLRHDDVRRTRASVPQSRDLAARAVVGLAHLDGIDVDATHIILVDGRGLDRRWLPLRADGNSDGPGADDTGRGRVRCDVPAVARSTGA